MIIIWISFEMLILVLLSEALMWNKTFKYNVPTSLKQSQLVKKPKNLKNICAKPLWYYRSCLKFNIKQNVLKRFSDKHNVL